METSKFLILAVLIGVVQCNYNNNNNNNNPPPVQGPLYLTPYIENGQAALGKSKAVVEYPPLVSNGIKSYSGYLTVNKTCSSNLFFWYFPAKVNASHAPLVLWLNGGPGESDLYGVFLENGPVFINSKNKLELRQYSWNQNHNLLYIDSPVGTGFSFTDGSCYLTNELDIGTSLFVALRQFYQLFPELRPNSLYIFGESYGGKYVPALGYVIYTNRNSANPIDRINLKGVAIGNGIIDPINQLDYGDYLYQLGFIDKNALATFYQYQDAATAYIQQGDYFDGLIAMTNLINWNPCLFNTLSGFTSPHNYLKQNGYTDVLDATTAFLVNSTLNLNLANYLHVGNRSFVSLDDSGLVLNYLISDITDTVAPWLAVLADNYKVLIYSGQLDLLAGPVLQENFLLKLPFSAANVYATASRNIWTVDNEIAGYVKIAGNLTELTVRLAGHMVPIDQPKFGYVILQTFTGNNGF